MIRNSVKFFVLLAHCTLTVSAEAKTPDYHRAQAIAKADPLEAEALYERFIRDTPHSKLRRAANYDLFYLRLRNGRHAEAFAQAGSKELGRKYSISLADSYGITGQQAANLVRRLQGVCSQEEEVTRIGKLLRSEKMPAPVWDFTLRVMLRCKAHGRSHVFVPDLFELEKPTRLQTQLRLIAIREQLYVDADKAGQLLAITRAATEDQYTDDEQLRMQLLVLEARIAAAKEDYDRVIARCGELASATGAKQAKAACDLLVAHAFLKNGDPAQAWKRIRNATVNPAELDSRLLRLTVAVAAGLEAPDKLVVFRQRASYGYCARSLRELADSVLSEKKPNKR